MSGLDVAASVAGIGAFLAVVIGAVLYGLGVLRPLKATARWKATKNKKLENIVFVEATLKSRTRNKQTASDAALVKDPGWPRRLRARFTNLKMKPFRSSSVHNSDLSIDNHDGVDFKGELAGDTLPYRKTRFWVKAAGRNFYFKLKNW